MGPWQGPTDIFPFGTNVVAGQTLVVLRMIVRCTAAITIRKVWEKTGLLFTTPEEYTVCLRLHSEVLMREEEGKECE